MQRALAHGPQPAVFVAAGSVQRCLAAKPGISAASSFPIRVQVSLSSFCSGPRNSTEAVSVGREQLQRNARLSCRAGTGAVQSNLQPDEGGGSNKLLAWVVSAALLAAAVALTVWHTGHAPAVKDALSNSFLGRSGFLASLSLIFLSEIGDKTFFIAALMAMKLGQTVAFAGTMIALSGMSVISVGIGYACKNVPAMVSTSVPVGEYLGIALLLYFGFKSIKEGLSAEDAEEGSSGSELSDAEEEVAAAEKGGKIVAGGGFGAKLLQVASIIFVAEWGDRSMLATIALGAAQSPVGVASGAIVGHAVATVIAILGGTLASKYISEKTISLVGGACFLLFAVLTALHIF